MGPAGGASAHVGRDGISANAGGAGGASAHVGDGGISAKQGGEGGGSAEFATGNGISASKGGSSVILLPGESELEPEPEPNGTEE